MDGLVTSLGQGKEEDGEELSPIIAQLSTLSVEEVRERAERSGQAGLSATLEQVHSGSGAQRCGLAEILAEAEESGQTGKARELVRNLPDTGRRKG